MFGWIKMVIQPIIGMNTQMDEKYIYMYRYIVLTFLYENTFEMCGEISEILVINDNNNFASSLFLVIV